MTTHVLSLLHTASEVEHVLRNSGSLRVADLLRELSAQAERDDATITAQLTEIVTLKVLIREYANQGAKS